MADPPRLIRDFSEIEARPDFDADAPCTLENFASVVEPYRFPDDDLHPCQVHKPDVHKPDGRCGHMHFNGWLAKIKDGRTVLVGSSCGPKYFDAHETFHLETRRIQREVDLTDVVDRLGGLLSDRAAFEEQLKAAFTRLRAARTAQYDLLEKLPYRIRRHLEGMVRSGNARVMVQIQYVEIDEKKRKHYHWIDEPLGSVVGASISQLSLAQDAAERLWKVKHALAEVVVDREAGYSKLKRWVEDLSQLSSVPPMIEKIERLHRLFATPENLSLLMLVEPNQDVQLEVAKVAVELSGVKNPTEADADAFWKKRDLAIRESNGGRNWRTHR